MKKLLAILLATLFSFVAEAQDIGPNPKPNVSNAVGTLPTKNGGSGQTSSFLGRVNQIVNATGGGLHVGQGHNDGGNLSNGTDTQRTYRYPVYFKKYTYDLKFHFSNGYYTSSLVQTGPGNSSTLTAAFECTVNGTATYIPLTFQGQTSVVLASNDDAWSDPVPMDVATNSTCYTRTTWTVSAGAKWAYIGAGSTLSSYSNNGADLANGTGALANSGSGASMAGPIDISGSSYPISAGSVCISGDSIANGTGDLGPIANNNLTFDSGYIIRGLGDYSATPNSFIMQPVGGTTAASRALPNNTVIMNKALSGCEYGVVEYGVNDLAGETVATLENNLTIIYNYFASRNIPVYQTTLLPNTTTTDNWQTATNQTGRGQTLFSVTAGTPATIGFGSPHFVTTGQTVTVTGCTVNTTLNGTWVVTQNAGTPTTKLDLNGSSTASTSTTGCVSENAESNRIAINDWIRTKPSPLAAYIDAANTVECNASNVQTQDGGRWCIFQTTPSVTSVATGGTSTTLVDSTQTWTVNQWYGYVVVITSGTGSGQSGQITSNTATTLTISVLGATPDATSNYIIQKLPSTTNLAGTHPTQPYHVLAAVPVAAIAVSFVGN